MLLFQKAINHFNGLKESRFVILMMGVIFIWCFLLGLQGFDLTDEGWLLSAYQQMFENSQSIQSHMLYYNGILIGSVWNSLFENWGILGFRVLTALLRLLICAVVYLLLRRNYNRWCVFLGLLILLTSWHDGIARYHNLLSILLAYVSIYLMSKSLELASWKYMFVAGVILGVNIFTRMPNIMMIGFLFCLIVFYQYNRNLKKTASLFLSCLLGTVFGVCIELFLLYKLNHHTMYLESLLSVFSSAESSDSTHNLWRLFSSYFVQYKEILKISLLFCGYGSFAYLCINRIQNKYVYILVNIVLFVMILNIVGRTYGEVPSFLIYAYCFVVMFISYLFNKIDKKSSYIVLLTFLMMILFPLGSECGVDEFGTRETALLSFPMCCGLTYELIKNASTQIKKIIIWGMVAIILPISVNGIRGTLNASFHDNGKRWTKIATSDNKLINVYSDKFKFELLDEASNELCKYVKRGDYLLCWQCCPVFHYLTHTYPYLNNPWPWIYDIRTLERQFFQVSMEVEKKPVVLCNKSSIDSWYLYDPNWDNEQAMDQWNFNSRKVMWFNKFVKDNGYFTVWENDVFRVMLPAEMRN